MEDKLRAGGGVGHGGATTVRHVGAEMKKKKQI